MVNNATEREKNQFVEKLIRRIALIYLLIGRKNLLNYFQI